MGIQWGVLGCCDTPCDAQDSPATRTYLVQKINSAKGEQVLVAAAVTPRELVGHRPHLSPEWHAWKLTTRADAIKY